jgi:chromosome segregation ATPase
MRKMFMFLTASAFLCAGIANAQDEAPSLGDVARQARQQKQQKDSQSKDASKTASSKDSPANEANPTAKADHVITNDQLPHTGLAGDSTHSVVKSADAKASDEAPSANDHDGQAEQWKSQILEQKNAIASLQHEIGSVSDSIHYAGANCVANCESWNEHQKQKQDQVEAMKSQLADQQKKLEDMQESARKQGFGSSVYEP